MPTTTVQYKSLWARMRARRSTFLVAAITAALCLTGAETGSASVATSTPSEPGDGYLLDWEDQRDWTLPQAPPPGWAYEYRPEVRHSDGEPQVRVANAANGEPVRN